MSLGEIKHENHFQQYSIRLSALRIQSFSLKKQIKQQSCNCFNYNDKNINNKFLNNKNFFDLNYYFIEFVIYYNDY